MVDNERKKRTIRIKPRVWADTKKLAELKGKKVGNLAGNLVEEALELEKNQKILEG